MFHSWGPIWFRLRSMPIRWLFHLSKEPQWEPLGVSLLNMFASTIRFLETLDVGLVELTRAFHSRAHSSMDYTSLNLLSKHHSRLQNLSLTLAFEPSPSHQIPELTSSFKIQPIHHGSLVSIVFIVKVFRKTLDFRFISLALRPHIFSYCFSWASGNLSKFTVLAYSLHSTA